MGQNPELAYVEGFSQVPLGIILEHYLGDLGERWARTRGLVDAILSRYPHPKVLDLSLGGGHDSERLIQAGHSVVSNEVDEEFVRLAQGRAQNAGISLDIRRSNWTQMIIDPSYPSDEFDVAFALGNSFPNYLTKEEDRVTALRGFWRVLRSGGTLFFDTRNFDAIERDREYILGNPPENFRYDGASTFLNSSTVNVFPVHFDEDRVRLCWTLPSQQLYAAITVWMATEQRVRQLISNALGEVRVSVTHDYQSPSPAHHDFKQYVLEKVF